MKTKTILDKIVENKIKEVEVNKRILSLKKIKNSIRKKNNKRRSIKRNNFKKIQKEKKIALIAEIKRASPSKGRIRTNFNLLKIAKAYNVKEISAISVITDKKFFQGDINYIRELRKNTDKPILRKDFIVEGYQVYESAYYGADAILLIAAILSKEQINRFISIANEYGMDCLVEVHNKKELDKVLKTKAEIIGINNRDLKTFKVDLNTTLKLLREIPSDKIVISESGFNSRDDIGLVKNKVDAVLIGTSIMKGNMGKKINELMKPKIKICGITNLKDALASKKADMLGFNFYKKIPRYITKENARKIISKLPKSVLSAGVFVNAPIKKVNEIAKYCNLDIIQLHGDESNNYIKKLKSKIKRKVIKVIRVKTSKDVVDKFPDADYFLFDAKVKGKYGGTGKTFNYNLLKNIDKPFFISGGLNPKNIHKAIKIDPYGVDVCSGVELRPGKKDLKKIKLLINKIK